MMGHQAPQQPKLFYTKFNLEQRIRANHPLRAVAKAIDFRFAYEAVAGRYGYNGNVSVAPPVLLKMMFLLYYYDVRSERELVATIPERLDWLWFLGYDIDEEVPDHSVLSKARKLWGPELFKKLFEQIVTQCVEAGLADGQKLHVDASLVKADASKNSVVDRQGLARHLNEKYKELEAKLDELDAAREAKTDKGGRPRQETNRRYVSTTDPDATLVSKPGEKRGLYYKEHRAVDDKHGVITATEVTTGAQNEGELLMKMVEQSDENTGTDAEVVVADGRYGTVDNYLACSDAGVAPHLKDLKSMNEGTGSQEGIFPEEEFKYDAETDSFVCPAGATMKRRHQKKQRDKVEYQALWSVCRDCRLRGQCTRSKTGRYISRHLRQEELDAMRQIAHSDAAVRDLKRRQHLMERSFADAQNMHSFKEARWRGHWRMRIQGYLIAAIQNIRILIRHGTRLRRKAEAKRQPRSGAIPQLLALVGFFAGRMVGRTSRGNQPVILGV
jgi:transposase